MKTFVHVVGARPNFMKAAPVLAAIEKTIGCKQVLVHTGQHYDDNMSEVFFTQLGLPRPDVNLDVRSGSHAVQTAQIMMRLEELLAAMKADLVLVYGDVNSTLATALVCAKLGTPVAHVEAGLRSFDSSMPEEINRIVTDRLADLLFTPSDDGDKNLLREGVAREKIFLVGNVMIDTLVRLLPEAERAWVELPKKLNIPADGWHSGRFALVTLHRPANVDDPAQLRRVISVLQEIAEELPVIFPVHPRTRLRMADAGIKGGALKLADPASYVDFLSLQSRAAVVITDSGGVQEETTYLGTPCLTLRRNTERPVTITRGTNKLLGEDVRALQGEVSRVLAGENRRKNVPHLWDGHASERIAEILRGKF